MVKLNFPPQAKGERDKFLILQDNLSKTPTGETSFTASPSGFVYTTVGTPYSNQGETGLMNLLYYGNIADGTWRSTHYVLEDYMLDQAYTEYIQGEIDDINSDITTINSKFIPKATSTIPVTGWVANAGDYILKLDLALSGVLSTDFVDITISPDYVDVAQTAEICPTTIEYNGGITILSKFVPTVAIPFTYKVVK